MRTNVEDNTMHRGLIGAICLGVFALGWTGWGHAAGKPEMHLAASEAVSTQPVASRPITTQISDSALPRHILKRFDFDERRFGNVEEVPMYWLRRKGPDLPHYNTGVLDHAIGHDAPPSFRLSAITESVAFTYSRNDIPVEPGNRYTVSGWIRTQDLRRSRAYISAAYLGATWVSSSRPRSSARRSAGTSRTTSGSTSTCRPPSRPARPGSCKSRSGSRSPSPPRPTRTTHGPFSNRTRTGRPGLTRSR